MKLIGRIFVALLLASGLLACTSKEEVPPPKPEATPPLPPPPAPEPPELPEVEPQPSESTEIKPTPKPPDTVSSDPKDYEDILGPVPELVVPDPSELQGAAFAIAGNGSKPVRAVSPAHLALVNHLKLAQETREQVEELLVEQDLKLDEINRSIEPGKATLEQIQEQASLLEEEMTAFEERIKGALSEEEFNRYRAFKASAVQRDQIAFLKPTIRDNPLSGDQEQELVRAMMEERKAFAFTHNYENRTEIDLEHYTDEAIEDYLKEFDALQGRYLERAKDILTPEQLEKFKEDQVSRRGSEHLRILGAAQTFRQAAGK